MGFIYKITNDVNNKLYIGKTELSDPYDRWKEHLQDYKRQRCEKRPLYEAINKYGTEHFHFEVIEETDNTEEREKYWIEEFRTYIGFKDCNGYNATLGGDGKSYLNLDEKEVIKYHIEEAIYVLGDTSEHFKVDSGTIRKILKKHNIIWLKNNDPNKLKYFLEKKGVAQVDCKSRLIVDRFVSSVEASSVLNVSKSSIAYACNSKSDHYAHGYLWYYGKDLEQAIKNKEVIDIYDDADLNLIGKVADF